MAFEDCVDYILNFEGGYVDDPRDKGGATKYGISSAFLRSIGDNTNPRDLTKDKAKEYYKVYFWDVLSCDKIQNKKVQILLFDTAVNMGINKAVRILQTALQIFTPLSIDGIIGSYTLRAINISSTNSNNSDLLIDLFITIRKQEYINIAMKAQNKAFIRGWFKRVNELARIINQ